VAFGIILTVSCASAQYPSEDEEQLAIFARSGRIARGGGYGSQVEILPVQQGPSYAPMKQVEALPNYGGGGGGFDSGPGYNQEATGGFGPPPGPNGIPPKEYQQEFGPAPGPGGIPPQQYQNQGYSQTKPKPQGGFSNGGGYGQQNQKPLSAPIQQGGSYGGQQQYKPQVQPIQHFGGGGYGSQRPQQGGYQQRQPQKYGSGNGISFGGNHGGSPSYQQQQGPGYSGGGGYGSSPQIAVVPAPGPTSYGGGQPLKQVLDPGHGYNKPAVELDSYSQPPVIPVGGGYGELAPPAQKAPVGYGR